MRLVNLKSNNKQKSNDCDICIIGAGAAGLFLAQKLAKTGKKIIILEAGDKTPKSYKEANFTCEFQNNTYSGATKGRFFGIGGSTYNWGGYLIPFSNNDANNASSNNKKEVWSHIVKIVHNNKSKVLKQLGINAEFEVNKDSFPFTSLNGIFVPFKKRNFSFMLDKLHDKDVTIYYNAVVSDYKVCIEESCSVKEISAQSINSNFVNISAANFVISAGTIESTRILLEMTDKLGSKIFKSSSVIGKFFSDHISWSVATVDKKSRKRTIKLFSYKFDKGLMRSPTFINIFPIEGRPRCFAKFQFDINSNGFEVIKSILYSIQHRKFPRIGIKSFMFGMSEFFPIFWSRFVKKRVYISNKMPVYLNIDIEQDYSSENCIVLSEKRDQFGRKKAKVVWSILEKDRINAKKISSEFINKWNNKCIDLGESLPTLVPNNIDMYNPHDVYHPAGTTQIGKNDESVVDFDLMVHGTDNLYTVSTGIFPTAGSGNSTFSMLCFANELSEHLSKKL